MRVRIFSIILLLISIYATCFYFYEYYQVGVLNEIGNRAFDLGEDTKEKYWQFYTPSNYSKFSLISGFLWLVVFALNLINIFFKKFILPNKILISILLVFVIQLIITFNPFHFW